MASIKDFLHPLWRDSVDKDFPDSNVEFNKTILDSIDEKLSMIEDETLKSKEQMFIKTAKDEWLDYWGSWFGLKRKNNQTDDSYRNAMLNHVKHPRNTKPALREAIANFLGTSISSVHIYEPWKDIFILNDSRLNSDKYFQSDYYQYGIIDIEISRPFNEDVIDVINWFRPAGVIWVLTYSPGNDSNADIWEMSPTNLSVAQELLTIFDYSGWYSRLNETLNLGTTDKTFGSLPFILNDSSTNSNGLLMGKGLNFGVGYYNSLGYLKSLISPTNLDNPMSFEDKIINNPYDDLAKLSLDSGNSVDFIVSRDNSLYNLLKGTRKFLGWSFKNGVSLESDKINTRSIAKMTRIDSSIESKQYIKLTVGETYVLSVSAKSEAISNRVNLLYDLDTAHKNLLLTDQLTKNFRTYTVKFTYTGSPITLNSLHLSGDITSSGDVYVSSIMLRPAIVSSSNWDLTIPDWTDSISDFDSPFDRNMSYVYGSLNIRKFFFDNIQSEGTVISKLGVKATSDDVNKYINSYLENKKITAKYHSDITDNVHAQLLFYNFKLGTWVGYQDDNLSDHKVDININANSLYPYMNESGSMFIAVSLTTLNTPYTFSLDYIGINLDKKLDYKTAYNIYSDDDLGDEQEFTYYNELDGSKDTSDMYTRYQKRYPIRYIRNIIGKVRYYKYRENVLNPDFLLNSKSVLNSNSVLGDFNYNNIVGGSDSDKYTSYKVIPRENDNGNKLPVYSFSVLGAKSLDSLHKNLLGNLLSGGIFYDYLSNNWNISNGVVVSKDKLESSDKLTSSRLYSSSTDGVISMTTDTTFSEENYRFTFDARNNESNVRNYVVNIYLISNNYSVLAMSKTFPIRAVKGSYKLTFDTNKVFPDQIKIEMYSEDRKGFDLTLGNTRLSLDTHATLDGKPIDNLPDIIPYSDDPEDSSVTYDDIQIDNSDYAMRFDTIYSYDYADIISGLSELSKSISKENLASSYEFKDALDSLITYIGSMGVSNLGDTHTLLVDLGKVHTDVDSILVHHGSDSDDLAEYDSIVQTSLDGIHWKTWYNNFDKDLGELDERYREPTDSPKSINLLPYNVMSSSVDYGKSYEKVMSDRYGIGMEEYTGLSYYADELRFPAYGLLDYVFGDSLPDDVVKLSTGDSVVNNKYVDINYMGAVGNGKLFVPSDLANNATTTTTTTVNPNTTTTTTTVAPDYGDDGIVFNGTTYLNSDSIVLDGSKKYPVNPNSTTTTTTTTSTTTSTTTIKPIDTKFEFLLSDDNSKLNSNRLLVDGSLYYVEPEPGDPDNPNNGDVPIVPTAIKDQVIIGVDLFKLVRDNYGYELKVLGINDDSNLREFLLNTLLGTRLVNKVLSINLSAKTTGINLTLSAWSNLKDGYWTNTENGVLDNYSSELSMTFNKLDNYLSADGKLYFLVASDNYSGNKYTIAINEFKAVQLITFNGIDDYNHGIYPHYNYAMQDSYIHGRGAVNDKVLSSIPISNKTIGRKVRVSFNVYSEGSGGILYVGNESLGVTTEGIVLEQGSQHVSFIMNLGNNNQNIDYSQEHKLYADFKEDNYQNILSNYASKVSLYSDKVVSDSSDADPITTTTTTTTSTTTIPPIVVENELVYRKLFENGLKYKDLLIYNQDKSTSSYGLDITLSKCNYRVMISPLKVELGEIETPYTKPIEIN